MQQIRKPAIYIIDALNFVRSFLMHGINYAKEDECLRDLISWLDELSRGRLYGSEFRLVIDGSFRNLGQREAQNVNVIFAQDVTADEIIEEQSLYLHSRLSRVIVVSSDREMTSYLKEQGVKICGCSKFFSDFYKENC